LRAGRDGRAKKNREQDGAFDRAHGFSAVQDVKKQIRSTWLPGEKADEVQQCPGDGIDAQASESEFADWTYSDIDEADYNEVGF
jgi:hypothetical protein